VFNARFQSKVNTFSNLDLAKSDNLYKIKLEIKSQFHVFVLWQSEKENITFFHSQGGLERTRAAGDVFFFSAKGYTSILFDNVLI